MKKCKLDPTLFRDNAHELGDLDVCNYSLVVQGNPPIDPCANEYVLDTRSTKSLADV